MSGYNTLYKGLAITRCCCCFWRDSPQWAMASLITRFLDHTQRRTTVGRTPLDEWSARRRDLYLTTHNTHNRQTSMPQVGFEPTISAGERPQTYALDRSATDTGRQLLVPEINTQTGVPEPDTPLPSPGQARVVHCAPVLPEPLKCLLVKDWCYSPLSVSFFLCRCTSLWRPGDRASW